MSERVGLVLALITGLCLGAMFFVGLWWTVQKGISSKRPALWFFVSMMLRTSITLAGVTLIARDHWDRLLVCILGFFIARVIVIRLTGPQIEHCNSPAKEAGHAP